MCLPKFRFTQTQNGWIVRNDQNELSCSRDAGTMWIKVNDYEAKEDPRYADVERARFSESYTVIKIAVRKACATFVHGCFCIAAK